MSRALYHLSYGTAGGRRGRRAHSRRRRARRAHCWGRSYRAACARAFSLRFLVRRFPSATRFLLFKTLQSGARGALPLMRRSRATRLRGCLEMVAEVGFEPTTFGL
jgi:hypothetical protein